MIPTEGSAQRVPTSKYKSFEATLASRCTRYYTSARKGLHADAIADDSRHQGGCLLAPAEELHVCAYVNQRCVGNGTREG